MKNQYVNPTVRAVAKAEQNHLASFLKSGDRPVYILSLLKANIPESTIAEIKRIYQNDNTIGVTGYLDTVAIVAKDASRINEIAKNLNIVTGKHVGIIEYTSEVELTKLYSDIYKAADLADKEMRNRPYDYLKDSLESKLGMTFH